MDQANCDVKAVLYAFLGKRKLTPEYSLRPTGPKHHQRFFCEVRVKGYDYVGAGNSTTKKDAQGNAAKDFIQYLLRKGDMRTEDLPKSSEPFPASDHESQSNTNKSNQVNKSGTPHLQGFTPVELGEAYRPLSEPGSSGSRQHVDFQKQNARDVADAESVDVNSSIHGNWTIENAKSKLHQFLQENRITADYRYSSIGPDHNNFTLNRIFCKNVTKINVIVKTVKLLGRSFVAEMSFFVHQLRREITAREAGSNKQIASKSCALSLVRQLFHLNVIGPFNGTLKRNPEKDLIKPFPVTIHPDVLRDLDRTVKDLDLTPITSDNSDEVKPQVLFEERLQPKPMQLQAEGDSSTQSNQGVVTWAPPITNWNPWSACNIDEGPLSNATLDNISSDLRQRFECRLQSDESLRKLIQDRENLPIFSVKNQIMEAIYENPVIIIRGNTGCGKTTQVCQYILDDYLRSDQGAHCSVVVTQPRRISATSVADRVAVERGEEMGESVGFSVRFESCLPRPYGSILFCTVGILLRRLERGLRGISHVIVDEIHERDVNTDFLLVVLRDIIFRHPELRIILMSATIDTTLFSRYFGDCPVVEIPGNSYPIQINFMEDCVEMLNFRPTPDPRKNKNKNDDGEKDDDDDNLNSMISDKYSADTKRAMALISERDISFELIEALLHHIKTLNIPGAVLIFLPGWNVIFTLLKYLQQSRLASSGHYCFLPLHSMLPREDQRRVFQPVPSHVVKVILATNIAETSITIDDVVFVIDSCRAKMKLFTSHNNMTHYATVWAAQSNLEQRRGRAGRVRPGYAYHLCSRARYERLEKHLTAEMLRSPLHETALSIKLLRLGSISHFLSKALEPPPIDSVIEAEVTLREMKCLDEDEELTPLGQLVARLPVEPSLAKMLIVGTIFHHGDAMCVLAASDSIKAEVFYHAADQARLTFRQRSFAGNRHSDHVALLSAFYAYEEVRLNQGPYGEANFCEAQSLSLSTLRVVYEARNQLRDLLISFGFPEVSLTTKVYRTCGDDPSLDTIVGLLSIGHYPNVCIHKEKRKVLTTESRAALIHKSSVNCASKFRDVQFPLPFFVFSEKIRTKAVSCKTMTNVTPLHLILFGSKKVQVLQESAGSNYLVRLDNWITLQMDPLVVAKILTLRPALDRLIFDVSANPEMVANLHPPNNPLIQIVDRLCHFKAADFRPPAPTDESQSPMGLEPPANRGAKRPHEAAGEARHRYERRCDQIFNSGPPAPYGQVRHFHSGPSPFHHGQGSGASIASTFNAPPWRGHHQSYGYHRSSHPRRGSYGPRGFSQHRGYNTSHGYQPPPNY